MKLTSLVFQQIRRHKLLHKWALRAYSLRHPPPYRRPNMEFEFDAWNGISSLHNHLGRMIGEDNAGPYPYREITGNQYETCRFRDSRKGLPMNVTNLRLVMPDAEDAYRLITVLRNRYIEYRKLGSPRLNLVQAYLFSKFAVSLPAFLVRRKDQPLRDGSLQALETAFYMLGTAPFELVRQLMVQGDLQPLDPQPLGGEKLYGLADGTRALISSGGRACPASPKLIIEFFDVILNGGFRGPLESPQVQRVLGTLGDWDRFYVYALAASRLELLIKLNQALVAQTLFALLRQGVFVVDDATQALLKAALESALKRIYVSATSEDERRTSLRTMLKVLDALLRDHGENSTLDELLATAGIAGLAADPEIDLVATPRRIRQLHARTLGACRRNLRDVHDALGRPKWGDISEQDLLKRIGGAEMSALLDRLEASAH